MQFVYLHGFASSPRSGKAQFLQAKFREVGQELWIPDLNMGDFCHITISQILDYLQAETQSCQALTVIGSSLGGFIASQWAIRHPSIERLILLAPALRFPETLSAWLGETEIRQWETTGSRRFWHYGAGQELPLHYEFFTDAQLYVHSLDRSLPIEILHGVEDTVVPYTLSQEFAQSRPWVNLHLLDSDHSLAQPSDLKLLWQIVYQCMTAPAEQLPAYAEAVPPVPPSSGDSSPFP
jgi:pimeloyl-ACP methyl ester carboxylesterase